MMSLSERLHWYDIDAPEPPIDPPYAEEKCCEYCVYYDEDHFGCALFGLGKPSHASCCRDYEEEVL